MTGHAAREMAGRLFDPLAGHLNRRKIITATWWLFAVLLVGYLLRIWAQRRRGGGEVVGGGGGGRGPGEGEDGGEGGGGEGEEDDGDDVDDDGHGYYILRFAFVLCFVWHLFALEGKCAVQQRDLCIISTNSVFYL